jgi:hypothetical protein
VEVDPVGRLLKWKGRGGARSCELGTAKERRARASWTGRRLPSRIEATIENAATAPAPARQETLPMANLIKIGTHFINIDQALRVDDLYPRTRENKMIVRFGMGEEHSLTLEGQDADDLRTWLNSIATNLRQTNTDLDTRG